ncbi:MAG: hypothetical protein ACJ789_04975 [Thermomicrobiales bacterium]
MSASTPPHVVILEGSRALANAFAARFAREGLQVTVLTDCGITPAELLRMHPDLVVLDIHCGPGVRGMTLLRLLRADPAGRMMPVLASPTITPIDLRRHGADLRSFGVMVLPEPVDVTELLTAVHAAVARGREARRQPAFSSIATAIAEATHRIQRTQTLIIVSNQTCGQAIEAIRRCDQIKDRQLRIDLATPEEARCLK